MAPEQEDPKGVIALRIRRVAVVEGDGTAASAEATMVGAGVKDATKLIPFVGQEVHVTTAGDRSQVGVLMQITFTAGKEDKPPGVYEGAGRPRA